MKVLRAIMAVLGSIVMVLSCKDPAPKANQPDVTTVMHKDYQLYKAPADKATLVLFPGGGTDATYTKQEFNIVTLALAKGISVLFMNFSRHIWIDHKTTRKLAEHLELAFDQHKLNTQNVTIGGMSIGGNVALTLGNFLIENNRKIAPKQLFVVDSPIDLYALYQSSLADLEHPDFDEERLAEPSFIINYFQEAFTKDTLLANLKKVSPFVHQDHYTSVPALANTKLRFYTEPDAAWWQNNRQTSFEHTNAYTLQKVYHIFKAKNWSQLELINTKDKGYRSNGERHPHSWSIVDQQDLVHWISQP